METEVKFGWETDSLFELLNPSVCQYRKKGTPFKIEETDKLGKAEVTIFPECPCFVVRNMDKEMQSLHFLNDACGDVLDEKYGSLVTKCADHAVFLFDNGKWNLHIFELKRSINREKWKEMILFQFNGAVIRSHVLAGAIRISEFSAIYLHCCYREYKSSPAELKTMNGKPAQPDFLKRPIPLKPYTDLAVKNAPIKLNENGCAEIRLNQSGYVIVS